MREMKNYLPSWRHSADTGANARRSKVIDGRIYDLQSAMNRHICGARASSEDPSEGPPTGGEAQNPSV